jgi:hypothetical protein
VRTAEFIPVAPCSLGKRQSESRQLDHRLPFRLGRAAKIVDDSGGWGITRCDGSVRRHPAALLPAKFLRLPRLRARGPRPPTPLVRARRPAEALPPIPVCPRLARLPLAQWPDRARARRPPHAGRARRQVPGGPAVVAGKRFAIDWVAAPGSGKAWAPQQSSPHKPRIAPRGEGC